MCFISTPNLCLRSLTEEDIPVWHKWFNDSTITRYMDKGQFPTTTESQLQILTKLQSSTHDLQLAIDYENKIIGIIGLHDINQLHQRADISILIGDPLSWGKNFATEAIKGIVDHSFNKLNLIKLTAGAVVNNKGSIQAFKKNGFTEEGVFKKHFFVNGCHRDIIKLALFKS